MPIDSELRRTVGTFTKIGTYCGYVARAWEVNKPPRVYAYDVYH